MVAEKVNSNHTVKKSPQSLLDLCRRLLGAGFNNTANLGTLPASAVSTVWPCCMSRWRTPAAMREHLRTSAAHLLRLAHSPVERGAALCGGSNPSLWNCGTILRRVAYAIPERPCYTSSPRGSVISGCPELCGDLEPAVQGVGYLFASPCCWLPASWSLVSCS